MSVFEVVMCCGWVFDPGFHRGDIWMAVRYFNGAVIGSF